MEISSDGEICDVGEIIDSDAMPWGTNREDKKQRLKDLRSWWSYRYIPKKRFEIDSRFSKLGVCNSSEFMVRCNSLNLSDHYWLRTDPDQSWSDLNLFSNGFDDDTGRFLFYGEGETSTPTPEGATDGMLRKMWRSDGVLIKSGTGILQEPFNEVIASELMDRLGIPHVKYWLEDEFSACHTISSDSVEIIHARCLMHAADFDNRRTMYSHLLNSCSQYDVRGVVDFVNRMIVVDCLLANTDRHYNNFSIMRDPVTLKPLGFAPMYDSGSSLGYDVSDKEILTHEYKGRTFKKRLNDQLALVTDFSWFRPENLEGIDQFAHDLLDKSSNSVLRSRATIISDLLRKRIEVVNDYVSDPAPFRDLPEEDIEV